MTTLKSILKKYKLNNNDCCLGTDKDTSHSYIEGFYEEAFLSYKNKTNQILEIGFCSGASTMLWSNYFTQSKITSLDITFENLKERFNNLLNVERLECDAYTNEVIKKLDTFDIIIEDGPHTLESQIFCMVKYLPKLNPGGIFVIEDVQKISWFNELEKYVTEEVTFKRIDLRKIKGRSDDLMFICQK